MVVKKASISVIGWCEVVSQRLAKRTARAVLFSWLQARSYSIFGTNRGWPGDRTTASSSRNQRHGHHGGRGRVGDDRKVLDHENEVLLQDCPAASSRLAQGIAGSRVGGCPGDIRFKKRDAASAWTGRITLFV